MAIHGLWGDGVEEEMRRVVAFADPCLTQLERAGGSYPVC